jgi:cytochrome c553
VAFAGLLALILGLSGCAGIPFRERESLSSGLQAAVPGWAKKEGFAGNRQAVAGANLFAASGCTNCHRYAGIGSSELGAPNLTAEGRKGRGVQFQIAHLKCPSCVTRGSPMPSFTALGAGNLRRVAVFLEASKGVG